MEHIEFYEGEQRYLDFEVKSTRKEPFSIVDADFVVTKKDGTPCDQGSATILNGNTVRFLFCAREKGIFVVKLDVAIPPELIEYKGLIYVV
jgi:hypothetical protein